jgi:outer membrane protein assembly factor BamB
MRWHGVVSALTVLLSTSNAIFADDAFHIDYHHALLGVPQSHTTFFHKPQASTNASLLYSISDKAVLGAINPKDGSVLWRQSLAGQPLDHPSTSFLVARERDGQIISGHGRTVSSWDALNGKLNWAYNFPEGTIVQGLQPVPGLDASNAAVQDLMVLTTSKVANAHPVIGRIAGDGSGLRWEHIDTSTSDGSLTSLATSSKHAYYVTKSHGLLASGKAKVVTFDIVTGKEIATANIAVDSDALGENGHYSAGSQLGYPFLISAEKPYKAIKVSPLSTSKVITLNLEDKGEEIESLSVLYPTDPLAASHFLLHLKGKTRQWAEVYHFDTRSGEAVKAYSLPATEEQSIFSVSSSGSTVYFTRSTGSELSLYSSESHGQLGRWQRTGAPALITGRLVPHAAAEVVSRAKDSFAVRIAETRPNGDWSLIRNGELLWTRPEQLAYANIAAWSDNVGPDALAEELEVEASINPLTAYVHRLKRHFSDLTGLPSYVASLPDAIFKSSPDSATDARRNLVGTKAVIVGTSRKELIALDATNAGALRWQTDVSAYAGDGVDIKSLTVSNGRTTVYLSDGSLVVVDTVRGTIIEHQQGTIPVSQLVHLPGNPAPSVVKVGADGTPHLADDFAPANPVEGSILVTISDDGNAIGWSIGRSAEKTWTLKPKAGFTFTKAIARPDHDPVASIGKVLGDRSVLYKYISPNIALLIATSSSTLTTYLVDAVTGAVLHTSSWHGIVPGTSIPAVLSENWFAFSFTSQDPTTNGLSTQLIISELYESAAPNERGALAARTNYSSFSADALTSPHVISQAYTVAEQISHLTVTQTAQGISSRQLLATLPESNAIVGIPREILDARRPPGRDANATEREEGLLKYTPVLELEPRYFLTHAREVIGIEKVIASPSLLESTSVIFAFGHDIFGTQVSPSLAFDVLGKGFNRIQLTLTVVALAVGVYVVRPIARKRTVEGRWKL